MTREKYAKLTDEEKRVKVAELRGLTCDCTDPNPELQLNGVVYWCPIHGDHKPCYLSNLNYTAEAEKALDRPILRFRYKRNLQTVLDVWEAPDDIRDFALITATAEQRAEAFVLTMEPA